MASKGGVNVRIKKVLNNNAVIVIDEGQEKIAIGAGVAFEKGKNDIVNINKIEKLFTLKENEKFQQLLQRIPEEHFILAEEIIEYAEKQLNTELNDHIYLALSDHISFAIDRHMQGVEVNNKLLPEIKVLYPKEFSIGLWAVDYVNEKMAIHLPVDEAAFIALHIHTMKTTGGDVRDTIREASILKRMIDTIQDFLGIPIDTNDLSYERLITHLRFALTRSKRKSVDTMDEEMLIMIKRKFAYSYRCAKKVNEELSTAHGIELPDGELGYIALHIERIRNHNLFN
jgi:beta-glucoside operon transcriptional antiterminator